MIDNPPWLWIVFTVLAAAGQTVRNAMQRELTATLGTVGATHVRFLFGFPFALATDADRSVATAYHALKENGTSIERSVYAIGPDGTIRYAARGIPDNSEVLAALAT